MPYTAPFRTKHRRPACAVLIRIDPKGKEHRIGAWVRPEGLKEAFDRCTDPGLVVAFNCFGQVAGRKTNP